MKNKSSTPKSTLCECTPQKRYNDFWTPYTTYLHKDEKNRLTVRCKKCDKVLASAR